MDTKEQSFSSPEVRQPAQLEVGQESVNNPDTNRMLHRLENWYRQRKILGRDQMPPLSEELDEIEIHESLSQAYGTFGLPAGVTLRDAEQSVIHYHDHLDKIDAVANMSSREMAAKSIPELFDFVVDIRKTLRGMEDNWKNSFYVIEARFMREQWNKRLEQGEKYIGSHEKFDGSAYRADVFFAMDPDARERLLVQYPELHDVLKRFHVNKYPNLQLRLKEAEDGLGKKTMGNPEEVRSFIARLHTSEGDIDSLAMDDLIGIGPEKNEGNIDTDELEERYGHEQYTYHGTPYDLIRGFLRNLNLSKNDVLYDLGCGYGRIPLYGAMTTPAKYRGIEIVRERVAEANAVKNKFQLGNVEFRQGNVLKENYADGSVFFLFSPFVEETLEKVGGKLQEIAKSKKIKVVSFGPSTNYFQSQDWLIRVESDNQLSGVTIFESR